MPGPIAAAAGEDVAQGREGRPSSLVIPLTTSLSVRPRPPRLHDVEGNAEPYEAIAEAGPEALGASPDRGGIDDAERAEASYPAWPIARRKSVMDAKRIMGFCRFSAPIVVCEPP